MPYFSQKVKNEVEQKKSNTGNRNTTGSSVQSQAQSQVKSNTSSYSAPQKSSQQQSGGFVQRLKNTASGSQGGSSPQSQGSSSSQRQALNRETQSKPTQRLYTEPQAVKKESTIQASVQNAPTVQQSASQQTRSTSSSKQSQTQQTQKQERTRWDTIKTIVETAAKSNKYTAPIMQIADAVERKTTPQVKYSAKTDTKNKQDENKSLTRKVVEKASDIIKSAPETIYNQTVGKNSVVKAITDFATDAPVDLSKYTQEQIDEAKQKYAMRELHMLDMLNIDPNSAQGRALIAQNRAKDTDGDDWTQYLPKETDKNLLIRTGRDVGIGIQNVEDSFRGVGEFAKDLTHYAVTGDTTPAIDDRDRRMHEFNQMSIRDARGRTEQDWYDDIVTNITANYIRNAMTGGLLEKFGLVDTGPGRFIGRGALGGSSFGSAYGDMRYDEGATLGSAALYGAASAINEELQELIPGGKVQGAERINLNLNDAIGEFKQEAAGALADPFVQTFRTNSPITNGWDDWGNAVRDAYVGMVTDENGNLSGQQALNSAGEIAKAGGLAALSNIISGGATYAYDTMRQLGTDIQSARDYKELQNLYTQIVADEKRLAPSLENNTQVPLNFNPALSFAKMTSADNDARQAQTDADNNTSVSDIETIRAEERAVNQIPENVALNPTKLSKEYVQKAQGILGRGMLRSSMPQYVEMARKVNEEVIRRTNINSEGKPIITGNALENAITISNRVGIPFTFASANEFKNYGIEGLYTKAAGGKLRLKGGVILLPDNLSQSQFCKSFMHEVTHTLEGTPNYKFLIDDLRKMEQYSDEAMALRGFLTGHGNFHGTERYARLMESFTSLLDPSMDDIARGKFSPDKIKASDEETLYNIWGGSKDIIPIAENAMLHLQRAINEAKYVREEDELLFDPFGAIQFESAYDNGRVEEEYGDLKNSVINETINEIKDARDEKRRPASNIKEKLLGEGREYKTPLKSDYADYVYGKESNKRDDPFDWINTPYANNGVDYTGDTKAKVSDGINTNISESDMEVFSDAVADVMGDDLTPITKDVFDKVAKTNEKAKAIGFDAFKQVMDEYDGRSDEYAEENMTEEEKEINLNRQYEEPGDYLSAKGIAPADAKRLGDNLKKKGDYSPYNYERGWKSLRSKGFSESEAKAFLDNFKDEYNKRFPQGLEAAQARAEAESQRTQEPEQKKSKKSESASINRMAAEDAREQRNRDKNAKPKFIFDKNGRVINAETRKPVENVKRTSLNEQSTEQAETEQKAETPRKTESQIYEETFNPTTKETKAETKKNEKVEETKTEEVKTEENKVEERKEETPKEETTVEPTATEQRTEPETISEERQRDLDTLAYFRNQEPENANLPRGMERVQRKADTETETKTTERVQTKSRIGKNDTEVASMDAHEMMRYFHNEDWSASDEFYEKNKADRDRIEGEVNTLVKEVEESKATPREEGNVENTLAALLYRAGCSLETANRFAKEVEETGKAPGKRDVQREIFNSHRTFADRQSADEFVERVVKAYKNMPSETRVENGQEVVRKTGTEMTGAEFNRMSAEPATGEGYTLDMDTTGATETTRVKADKVRKRDAIYERVEEKVKNVNEASKEIRGKEFTSKEQENIRGAETLAEETREEQIKQTQARTDEYVNQQAEAEQQTSQQTEQTESGAQSQNTQQNQQSTNNQQSNFNQQTNSNQQQTNSQQNTNQSNNQQDAGQQQQDRMRDKANERRTRPDDTSIHATMEKLRKNKNVDPSITARIDESLSRKAVVHDAEVRKDADEWLKQGGLKNAISYAEGILQQNNPAVTEEELVYLEKAFEESNKLSQDIRAQIEKLEKANRPEDAEALSILRDEQKRATDNATTVVEAMANAASEAGRVLRVMRFLQQSPITATNYIQRTIDKLNKVYAKDLKNKKLTLDQSLIDEYVNAKDDNARDAAMEKIEYQIADQLPRKAGDMVKQWRMTCMLTNPRTHMRNIISNGFTYGLFRLTDTTQAGIEWAIMHNKSLQKALNYNANDKKAVRIGAVGKEYREVAEWLDKAHQFSKEKTGNGKFSEYDARLAAGSFSNKNALGKLLNKVNKFNNDMLEFEDKFFVQGRARISLAQMLQTQGYTVERSGDGFTIKDKNGKTISDKVLKGMEKAALHDAQEATYHDFNQMAKFLNDTKKRMGKAGVVLDVVVPFVKTPANILNLSLQYSPVGLMYHATADLGKVRSGEMSASTYVTRVSRGVTGTALFLIGAALANAGIISKPEDDDEDGRTSYYQSNIFGRQPLALHLGDKYYSLDWAMPTAAPFMMGASFAGTLGRYGKNLFDLDELPENMAGIIRDTVDMMNPVLEASYLSSLNDMLTSFVQGSNYGGEIFGAGFAGGMERMGESIAENFVGQLSPTFGGAINRTIDPVKRTTSANTSWERMVNRTLMNIPGMSKYLQPAIDQKGQELENFDFGIGGVGRAIYNTLVPSTITVDTHDDFDSALMDVGAVALPRNQTGTGGLKGQIYYDLEKMGLDIGDITSEEYTQVKKTYYGNYRQYAEDYNELAEYNNLGTHARDDVYKKLEQLALAEAKEVYYKRVGDVSELYKDEQIAALELKRLGVSPAQFYLMKDCGLTGNRRALYVASELERLGVMDEVEQAILNQKCFPSAFGLTDSILVKTPDEREAAREKYLNEDGETLESVVAAYRAMSNEEYENKKKEDSEETVQESWESLFSKYDKKYGTHYADAFAELNGKENTGAGSKGKGTGSKGKGSRGGRKKSSTKTTKTKTASTKNYTPRVRSGRRSSGGGGSSVDADTLALFERFMKYANGALKSPSKSNSGIKASVSTSSEAALFDSIVNSSKSDVEKLKRELGLK